MHDRARELRDACRAALDATVSDPAVARAVGRELGIDKTLAWKLVTISRAEPAAEALATLPGRRGWTAIIDALDAGPSTPTPGAAVRRAVEHLEAEAANRGLSRAALRSMAAVENAFDGGGLARDRVERLPASLTATNSAIWGVECRATLRSHLIRGRDHATATIGRVTGFAGLHRTRPGPEWPLLRISAAEDESSIDCNDLSTPGAASEIGTIRHPSGNLLTFRGDRTSPSSTVDVVVADRGLHPAGGAPDGMLDCGMLVRIPTRLLVLDVVIERTLVAERSPELVTNCLIGAESLTADAADLMQLPTPRTILPPRPVRSLDDLDLDSEEVDSMLGLTIIANHAAALGRVADVTDADPTDFIRYRAVIEHPLLSTMIAIRLPGVTLGV